MGIYIYIYMVNNKKLNILCHSLLCNKAIKLNFTMTSKTRGTGYFIMHFSLYIK